MNDADTLRVERNLLEFRLAMLEQAIETQHLGGMEAPELAARMPPLFERLSIVNTKLAELRGPAAST